MNQKINRLQDYLTKLQRFNTKPSEVGIDDLCRMITSEYSLEENSNHDFSSNQYLVDLKETKSILNDLLDSINKPKNRVYYFELILMHFKKDIENELFRLSDD